MSSLRDKKILIIDDEPDMLGLLERIFSEAQAEVITAGDGEEGLRELYAQQPELVVLDIMLPELDGWEVCARIRQLSEVPIVFLTALGRQDDVVRGLNGGAVDYVTKPFSPKVLVARAQAALRRAQLPAEADEAQTYRNGHLTIDLLAPLAPRVLLHGDPVRLTATEHRMLAYLVENAGQVLTFQQILTHVWGPAYLDSPQYVHVYISRLRHKLKDDPANPRYVLTVHGVGYSFCKP